MEGWIKLYRKMQEHWLWNEKRKFSKFEAWIDILFRANHKDSEIIINWDKVEAKKGSFITSEVKLAKKWKWDRSTVRRFLTMLEEEKMISKKSTTNYTMISVEKWELYQNVQQQNQQQDNSETTTGQHQNNTNKNEKNIKNDKNISKDKEVYIPPSEEKTLSASVKASKHKYGEYQNVLLKDEELQKLKEEYQNWEELIRYLDEYIEMKGYKAKSHYLCIKKWVVDAVNKKEKGVSGNGKNANNVGKYQTIDFSKNRTKWSGEEIDDTGLI